MNIIELAKKAGMRLDKHNGGFVNQGELIRFTALVLEEAAKVCEDLPDSAGRFGVEWDRGTMDCADAIRALKGAKE